MRKLWPYCFECQKRVPTCEHTTFLRFGNGQAFEEKPIVNHMAHWAPWAEHFRNSEDKEKAILANMLGYAEEEIDRLRRNAVREGKARSALLWAFIDLVDRLCPWCARKPVPFGEKDNPSILGAWDSIQQLNEWRRTNKLNIKQVDTA